MPRPVDNPPNRFAEAHVAYDEGAPPDAKLQVIEERVKSALSKNDSPDLTFTWSLNPYRGCYHGCIYCYARPSHAYWGYGAGTDFERKIVVKTNVAERLRDELSKDGWQGELIAFSGNTDCYQPLEASFLLTRRCLEVCLEARNPVSVITKSALVRRDADVLRDLARDARLVVTLSIAFADDETGHRFDPWASPISRRFEALRTLSDAGIPTAVSLAPLIPGVNDAMIPQILERARDAGARSAWMTMLRLPREVREIFDVRVEELWPERAKKIKSGVRELRGGRANESRFGARMKGTGERWRVIEQLFETHRARLGFAAGSMGTGGPTTYRRPSAQLSLFE